MEENKIKSIKDMSLEELREHCVKLNDYLNQAVSQLRQMRMQLNAVEDIKTKLPFLFEIVRNKEVFSPTTVSTSIEEIETILFPPKEEEKEEE